MKTAVDVEKSFEMIIKSKEFLKRCYMTCF